MTLLLIAGVALCAAAFVFFKIQDECSYKHDVVKACMGTFCILTGLAGTIVLVAFCLMAMPWVGAGHKARILNAEYGTSYTQEDVFYASDVIDTIRNLDRKRIEINGDLMRHDDEIKRGGK